MTMERASKISTCRPGSGLPMVRSKCTSLMPTEIVFPAGRHWQEQTIEGRNAMKAKCFDRSSDRQFRSRARIWTVVRKSEADERKLHAMVLLTARFDEPRQ